MASAGKFLLAEGRKILQLSQVWQPCITQVRWNRYHKEYLAPTLSKEELSQPLDERDLRKYRPIKAAKNDETSSLNHDELVAKFTRLLLRKGRKELARKIVDKAFQNVKLIQIERYHKAQTDLEKDMVELDPRVIFHQAVENCKPLLITQKVKRGGVIYQVPIPVKPNYQTYKGMTWLIESAIDHENGVRVWEKLATELLDAARNEGKSIRKKQELHRVCEANRAYAHFRW